MFTVTCPPNLDASAMILSTQIRTLLDPPKDDVSIDRAIELLNSNLKSLDDTENDQALDRLLAEAQDNSEALNSQVRVPS